MKIKSVRKIVRNELKNIDLELFDYNGNNINMELEPWQVEAVIRLLGLNLRKLSDGRFEVIMYPQNLVEKMLEKVPEYQWVKK